MTQRKGVHRGAVCIAALASFFAGACDRPVETRTENVRQYIRNASVDAAVRRLDKSAQEYVDGLLSAYETYRDAFDPIAELATDESLWPLSDEAWRDTERVKKRHEVLETWRSDTPDADDSEDQTRPELLAELEKAIKALPSLPDATPSREADLIDYATTTLDPASLEPKYDEIARLYHALTAMAIERADKFIPDATGLVFTDESLTARAASTWTKLHDLIIPYYDAEDLAKIKDEVSMQREERAKVLKQKQSLRGQISSSTEKLREYRDLELLVQYYDALVSDGESKIKKIEKALADEKYEAG